MKVIHVEAKANVDVKDVIKKVRHEGKLGLMTTIQFVNQLKDVHKLLPNSVIGGQVLGCNVSKALEIIEEVDAYLYIGSGEFHPLEIALETGKEVIWANPFTNEVKDISKDEIEKRKKRIKGAYMKFLASDKVGILVSSKKGQNQMKAALEFQKSLEKKSYIFLFNTLDFNDLENFPDIDCWVNTACARIAIEDYDKFRKPVINLKDIERLKK